VANDLLPSHPVRLGFHALSEGPIELLGPTGQSPNVCHSFIPPGSYDIIHAQVEPAAEIIHIENSYVNLRVTLGAMHACTLEA
jgi:hypothetical protein